MSRTEYYFSKVKRNPSEEHEFVRWGQLWFGCVRFCDVLNCCIDISARTDGRSHRSSRKTVLLQYPAWRQRKHECLCATIFERFRIFEQYTLRQGFTPWCLAVDVSWDSGNNRKRTISVASVFWKAWLLARSVGSRFHQTLSTTFTLRVADKRLGPRNQTKWPRLQSKHYLVPMCVWVDNRWRWSEFWNLAVRKHAFHASHQQIFDILILWH